MNRNNIWIHLGLAFVLVSVAAVLGQIERWRSALRSNADRPRTEVVAKNEQTLRNSSAEVLVRFKPGTTLDQIRAIAAQNHDELEDEIESVSGLSVIDDLDNADAASVAAQYAAMSNVAYAEPNFRIKLNDPIQEAFPSDLKYRNSDANFPNDPLFTDQWALNNSGADGGSDRADIDAIKAWATSKGSDDVVVAVVDSGVDYGHPDLKNNIWTRPRNIAAYSDDELGTFDDVHGFSAVDKLGDPMDDNGHGTHCAGIIGAEGDNGIGIAGINWHVKIMPLKYLDRNGVGTTEDAIEVINYAIDRKKAGVNLRVINASWGSTEHSQALEDTIRAAGEAGILFVAAAGNDGTDNDEIPHYPSNFDLPNIISVAAVDRNDRLTAFSNFGERSVHIAAPGKDILSTYLNGEYRVLSGTSMAAPYVTGVAALIVAADPNISMSALRSRLLRSVDKLDTLTGRSGTAGRLCAANALAK